MLCFAVAGVAREAAWEGAGPIKRALYLDNSIGISTISVSAPTSLQLLLYGQVGVLPGIGQEGISRQHRFDERVCKQRRDKLRVGGPVVGVVGGCTERCEGGAQRGLTGV